MGLRVLRFLGDKQANVFTERDIHNIRAALPRTHIKPLRRYWCLHFRVIGKGDIPRFLRERNPSSIVAGFLLPSPLCDVTFELVISDVKPPQMLLIASLRLHAKNQIK